MEKALKYDQDNYMQGDIEEGVLGNERENKKIFLDVRYKQYHFKLGLEHILYISISKRGSQIHICDIDLPFEHNGVLLSNKKVCELFRELSDSGFAYAHNSYIVNLRYVKIRSREEIELINGEMLSVSRSKLPEFRKRMEKHLEKDRDNKIE